ncbi:MAG: Mur ligase family protein [Bacteroidetes bacterium]|nr:Mur ligase family protein [Bacteroidota bacterium]MDA1336767.1 Mur ligase family protein [Bacteroidota bacterium]
MRIHLIAIGGSAMHNIALALHRAGHSVTGSDDQIREPSKSRLYSAGIAPENEGWFPDKIDRSIDIVILGMHAKSNNPELLRAMEIGLTIQSYPEFLYHRNLTQKRIVIGGSHGKTTITSMVMHAMQSISIPFNYMVGAQLENFDCMVRIDDENEWAIFEGDEYLSSPIDSRPKFLWYRPQIALLSGIAWDHINVFPTKDHYVQQFEAFITTIEKNGQLIWCEEDQELSNLIQKLDLSHLRLSPYKTPKAMPIGNSITELEFEDGASIKTQLVGAHNYQNIGGARSVATAMGLDSYDFDQAITTFKGAAKRLETLVETDDFTLYQDFAHAPSKVRATTESIRTAFPNRQLTAVLELHTFSSLNAAFLPTYKNSLNEAHQAIVFFDPKVLESKGMPILSKEFVQSCFCDDQSVQVITSIEELQQKFSEIPRQQRTVLLMTSGWFGGLNIREVFN